MKTSHAMKEVKRGLLKIQEKMSPQERLSAFMEHSRLLACMFEAGAAYRRRRFNKK